jgi:hypothetical protein
MGTDDDYQKREDLRRTDSKNDQNRIEKARQLIFERGYAIKSDKVENILKSDSSVPTRVGYSYSFPLIFLQSYQNAFSTSLLDLGFNYYSIVTIDLLHEFELGIFLAIFAHLVAIYIASHLASVHELNWRSGFLCHLCASHHADFVLDFELSQPLVVVQKCDDF